MGTCVWVTRPASPGVDAEYCGATTAWHWVYPPDGGRVREDEYFCQDHNESVSTNCANCGDMVVSTKVLCDVCSLTHIGYETNDDIRVFEQSSFYVTFDEDGWRSEDTRFTVQQRDGNQFMLCEVCGWSCFEVTGLVHRQCDRHWATHVDPLQWIWLSDIGEVIVVVGNPADQPVNPYHRERWIGGDARLETLKAFRDGVDLGAFITVWHAPAGGGARMLWDQADVRWETAGRLAEGWVR